VVSAALLLLHGRAAAAVVPPRAASLRRPVPKRAPRVPAPGEHPPLGVQGQGAPRARDQGAPVEGPASEARSQQRLDDFGGEDVGFAVEAQLAVLVDSWWCIFFISWMEREREGGEKEEAEKRLRSKIEVERKNVWSNQSFALSFSLSPHSASINSPQANTTASIGGEEAYGGRSLVSAPTEDSDASESKPLVLASDDR